MSSSIMSRELALVVVGLCLPLQSSLTCTLTQAEIRKHMGTLSSEVHQLNSHVKSAYINTTTIYFLKLQMARCNTCLLIIE